MEQNDTPAHVLKPKEDVFSSTHVIESNMLAKGAHFHVYERTEYPEEGGIYVYYKDLPFPKKGFPFPEAIWMNDTMKRILVTVVKSIGTKDMILPYLAFAILPWKKKLRVMQNAIDNVNRVSNWLLRSNFLTENRYSNPCRTIRKFLKIFLIEMGITEKAADEFALMIASVIEYDDAYRYRIEDIATEAKYFRLATNPSEEINRLLQIFARREYRNPRVRETANTIGFILKAMLYHPKIKRAFKKAVNELTSKDFDMLKLDNADRYHVLLRDDYNFTDRTFAERKQIYIDFHKDRNLPFPKEVTIN